jgi:hypothetical protein
MSNDEAHALCEHLKAAANVGLEHLRHVLDRQMNTAGRTHIQQALNALNHIKALLTVEGVRDE